MAKGTGTKDWLLDTSEEESIPTQAHPVSFPSSLFKNSITNDMVADLFFFMICVILYDPVQSHVTSFTELSQSSSPAADRSLQPRDVTRGSCDSTSGLSFPCSTSVHRPIGSVLTSSTFGSSRDPQPSDSNRFLRPTGSTLISRRSFLPSVSTQSTQSFGTLAPPMTLIAATSPGSPALVIQHHRPSICAIGSWALISVGCPQMSATTSTTS